MAPLSSVTAAAAAAAGCMEAPAQPTLTSQGCPTNSTATQCRACVVYSSAQSQLCSASDCETDATCALTFQCLASPVNSTTKIWSLQVAADSLVTQISNLSYAKDDEQLLAVELSANARVRLLVDDSVFTTPDSVSTFRISGVDLTAHLARLASHHWQHVALTNAGIRHDSPGLADLGVRLPSLRSLDLSGNPLSRIPSAVFRMPTLRTLVLRDCGLRDLHLSQSEFELLDQQLHSLTITSSSSSSSPPLLRCRNGYAVQQLSTSTQPVCVVAPSSSPLTRQLHDTPATTTPSSSNAVTAGVAIGAGVVVLLALLAWFLCLRRRRSNAHAYAGCDAYVAHGRPHHAQQQSAQVASSAGGGFLAADSQYALSDLLALRVEHHDVELQTPVSSTVWRGVYQGQPVAIKRLANDHKTMTHALAFVTEITLMAQLQHRNIVGFVGVSWTNAVSVQALAQWMPRGDLRSLLDVGRATEAAASDDLDEEETQKKELGLPVGWGDDDGGGSRGGSFKCQVAIDVADALVYLLQTENQTQTQRSEIQMVKARHVLLPDHDDVADEELHGSSHCKLSLFAVASRLSSEPELALRELETTHRWMAPEIILGESTGTNKSVVYSFGVLLCELDTPHVLPFGDAVNPDGSHMSPHKILQLKCRGEIEPTLSHDCPLAILTLIRECMALDPTQRPSAERVAYTLKEIRKNEW